MKDISDKTIIRLGLYRRIVTQLLPEVGEYIRSSQIAQHAQGTSAQVRRDIMELGCIGKPSRGYQTHELLNSIANLLDPPDACQAALFGVGNLGRALLTYLVGRRPNMVIKAAFDKDEEKHGMVINGCPCYHIDAMENVINNFKITVGILALPASCAQEIAEKIVSCGITGILNFAPVKLKLPDNIYVDDMDISSALERVAFFARRNDT